MRNSWIRAWIATAGLLAAAAVLVRDQSSLFLRVEEPVMTWLLDGTDTSIWDRAEFFSNSTLLVGGTILLVIIGFVLSIRVGLALIVTSILGYMLSIFVRGFASRPGPIQENIDPTFANTEIVQTGVFWGLVVMMLWWVGAPKLVWQVVLEISIVITLVVSIRLIVAGEIWPSDAVGSAIVVALSLVTAAAVLEANPAKLPTRNRETETMVAT